MRINFNFNLKNPDNSDCVEHFRDEKDNNLVKSRPIKAAPLLCNFLISVAKHTKLTNDRAWNFAQQLANPGIIETDAEGANELLQDISEAQTLTILVKKNLEGTIQEAKKKLETEKSSEKAARDKK
jgi:hypothetical protein